MVELKHLLFKQIKDRQSWTTINNLKKEVKRDVQKLEKIKGNYRKYIIILCTKNPGKNDWEQGIDMFKKDYKINCLNNPKDFPEQYYLALLEVD